MRTILLVTATGLFFTPATARGQEERAPEEDTEESPSEESLSPEELDEIEEALEADAEDLEESRPEPREGLAPEGERGAPRSGSLAGLAQALNPDLSLITDVTFAWFSDDDNLQTGAHDPRENGFNLQQVELSVSKAVDPYFRIDGNIVFGQVGVEVEEIFATTLALPWNLQARVGQFQTRIGRINPTHPHTWAFVDQPFVLGRLFGGEGNRGVGAELSYLTPLPWYAEVIGSVNMPESRSFFAEDLELETPLDLQSSLILEQFFDLSPNWSLLWGLSATTGPNSTGRENRTDIYATDLYLKYRPITRASYTSVELQLEWFHRRRQVPEALLLDHGGYAHLFWRFAKRWGSGLRYEYGSPIYDGGEIVSDDLDPAWVDDRHRATAVLTFWPTEFSRVRLQGSADVPTWRDDPIYAGFLNFEFTIGAHGAHEF